MNALQDLDGAWVVIYSLILLKTGTAQGLAFYVYGMGTLRIGV